MTVEQKSMIEEDIQKIKDASEDQNLLWLDRKMSFMIKKYSELIPGFAEGLEDKSPNDPDFAESVEKKMNLLIRKLEESKKL